MLKRIECIDLMAIWASEILLSCASEILLYGPARFRYMGQRDFTI